MYEGRSKSFKHRIFAEGFCSNLYCTLKEKDLLMGFMSKYFKSGNYAISTGEMFTLMSTVANRKVISLVLFINFSNVPFTNEERYFHSNFGYVVYIM